MIVLITGGGGQLGQELQSVFKRGKTELGGIPKAFEHAVVITEDIDTLDISDIKFVRGYVSKLRPDIIINCAAFTNVDGCESNIDTAFNANVLGPRNLAVVAEEIRSKLVHVSTDYVFSGDNSVPYREWDIKTPNSIYGFSKHLGEEYVREFCRTYFIVRTAWLYGYVGNNFVKTILRAGRERDSLKVVDDQRGNPTNAADLAHYILKIAATDEYGVYHCTNNGECSWYDFACEFVRLAGLKCEITPCTTEEFPRPAKRPMYSVLDNLMLRCTLGDEMRPWQDAIAAYMTHYDKESGEINP